MAVTSISSDIEKEEHSNEPNMEQANVHDDIEM